MSNEYKSVITNDTKLDIGTMVNNLLNNSDYKPLTIMLLECIIHLKNLNISLKFNNIDNIITELLNVESPVSQVSQESQYYFDLLIIIYINLSIIVFNCYFIINNQNIHIKDIQDINYIYDIFNKLNVNNIDKLDQELLENITSTIQKTVIENIYKSQEHDTISIVIKYLVTIIQNINDIDINDINIENIENILKNIHIQFLALLHIKNKHKVLQSTFN